VCRRPSRASGAGRWLPLPPRSPIRAYSDHPPRCRPARPPHGDARQAPAAPERAPAPGARPSWYWAGLGTLLLTLAVAGYLALSAALAFVQVKADDLTYGRPRTTHLDAYFGHAGEAPGRPTHILAVNLDRRVVVIELPAATRRAP